MLEHPVRLRVLIFQKDSENLLDNPSEEGTGQSAGKTHMVKSKIKPEIAYYLCGFADGEGSFNVSLRKRSDHTLGWQIVLTFNVAQRESYILSQFKKHLGCGRLVRRKCDGLFMYVVDNPLSLQEKVIPFFKEFGFLSQTKKYNFLVFCQIAELVFQKKHLESDGFRKIIALREKLNIGRGRKRKYNQEDCLKIFNENPQRLHAKPRIFRNERKADDIVRSSWKHEADGKERQDLIIDLTP